MRRRLAHGLAIACMVAGLGAAQGPNISEAKPAPVSPTPTKPEVSEPKAKPYQVGTASWYGEFFQGKETASGERYNMHDMTAAHLTLPMGSYVKVTNLRNGRAVIVRVNDRGPIVPGRIIDLSYGAAEVLKIRGRGLQRVRLDLVPASVAKATPAPQPFQSKPVYQTVADNRPIAQLP